MAREIKEVAHLRTDTEKFNANWDRIDWGTSAKEKEEVLPEETTPTKPVDLSQYKSSYTKNSREDGRIFLGRQVVPGTCRVYDTVEKTFTEMSKTSLARNFTKIVRNNKLNFKRAKITGHKVRELKKAGIEITVKPDEPLEEN